MLEDTGDKFPIRPPETIRSTLDTAKRDAGTWWYQILSEQQQNFYAILSTDNGEIQPPPDELTVYSFTDWLDSTLVTMGKGKAERVQREYREGLRENIQVEATIAGIPTGDISPQDAAHVLGKYIWAWRDYYVAETSGNEARSFFSLGEVCGLENIMGQFHLDGDRRTINRLFKNLPIAADQQIFVKARKRIDKLGKK